MISLFPSPFFVPLIPLPFPLSSSSYSLPPPPPLPVFHLFCLAQQACAFLDGVRLHSTSVHWHHHWHTHKHTPYNDQRLHLVDFSVLTTLSPACVLTLKELSFQRRPQNLMRQIRLQQTELQLQQLQHPMVTAENGKGRQQRGQFCCVTSCDNKERNKTVNLFYNGNCIISKLSSQNVCIIRFWQLFCRNKTFFFFFITKVVSGLITHIKYTLRLIRWEWLSCFYYIFC